MKKRVKCFDMGIQVKEYDFPATPEHRIPVLQIVEGVEVGVQVDEPAVKRIEEHLVKPPPRKRHTGTQAKPNTNEFGQSHKVPFL